MSWKKTAFEEDWQACRANEVPSGQLQCAIWIGLFFIKKMR